MYKVAIIAFDNISMFHLSVPVAIFSDAQPKAEFDVIVCAEQTGAISTRDGTSLLIQHDLVALDEADIIIFPSWEPDQALTSSLKLALFNNADKLLVGLCLGSYALALAGLLDNRKATTHWAYAVDFSTRFPQVELDTDALFVEEGNVITSAGTAAAIDCCLQIVKQKCGVKLANQVARTMVSAPIRAGGQSQFIKYPMPEQSNDKRLSELVEQIVSDLTATITLAKAANQVAMSERSFSRHFKQNYGVSFVQWLTQQRLNYALELLESSKLSIALLAEQSGFSSEQNFRKLFKQHFSITPQAWRKQFA